jgi:hypothetical protein
MRHLLAATCLTPIALAAAAPASAQLVINNARTTSVETATANNGQPADIRITTGGSVRPTTQGAVVTLNSNNSVKNEGSTATAPGIGTNNVSNSTGILVVPGFTGNVENAAASGNVTAGIISIVEDYAATDSDSDGDLDGPFAQGTNRFGIRVQGGGTHTGNITNGGTITVEGNNSAGISVEGNLNGRLVNTGTVSVLGNDSYGIRTTGDLTGNSRIAGTIAVRGGNSVAVAVDGDVNGALEIQGVITASGYRTDTAPNDASKLEADDILQSGPAVRIAGNVTGGVVFASRPADNSTTNNDEDGDGITDSEEGNSTISVFGSAPAIQIGSTTEDTTIGAIAGNSAGHGLVVNGTVSARGVYSDVAATGIEIGGRGGAVNIAGGMTIGAEVTAVSRNANATGIRIGNEANVGTIAVTRLVSAEGGSAASSLVEAISIDAGASVDTITNSGTIRAGLTGTDGVATAIMDRSGGLDLIENTGAIGAVGAPFDSNRAIAIDVSSNAGGVTVRQNAVAANASAPAIVGNIRFGTGNDVLEVADGTVNGNTTFGAGSNRLTMSGDAIYTGNVAFGGDVDTISLAGTSRLNGNLDFGGGADTLTLAGTSAFSGRITNGANATVNVNGGTFDVTNTGRVDLGALTTAANSTLTVTLDPEGDTHTLYDIAGAASFGANNRVAVRLSSIGQSEGTFTIIEAGELTGGANLSADTASLPFLYAGSVAADEAADRVSLTIRRKTAEELAFNRSEASAYGAIFEALDKDEDIADVFLGIDNGDDLRTAYRQLLPEHAGGTFESVTQASRATARMLQDRRLPVAEQGRLGVWAQQVIWGTSKDIGNTAAYDISGWGAAAGAETQLGGAGTFGASFGYLLGKNVNGGNDNQVDSNQFELAGYWRGNYGPIQAHARVSGAFIKFEGLRRFTGTVGTETITRQNEADWNGNLLSAAGGASYEYQTGRLSFRPTALLEYYRLSEGGYTETGGGEAFDLQVSKRTGDEVAATGSLVVGYDFGSLDPEGTWLRVEAEGGRRQILAGELGATTARFAGGDAFTLAAEERESGWVGKLRLAGGTPIFRLGGEFSAEEQQGKAAVAFRIGLNAAF